MKMRKYNHTIASEATTKNMDNQSQNPPGAYNVISSRLHILCGAQYMPSLMTSWYGNIFLITGHFCEKLTNPTQKLPLNLSYFNMMTSSNGNIFRVTGHLCGEFTGPCEFPAQRPVTRSFDVFFDLRLKNDWVNNREVGDLRRYRAHYDVIVMIGRRIVSLPWQRVFYFDNCVVFSDFHIYTCLNFEFDF